MYMVYFSPFLIDQLTDTSLVVGSAVALSDLIELLLTHKDSSPTTFSRLADHLTKIASVPVRNVSGCIN